MGKKMKQKIAGFRSDESGVTAIEYALIAGLIAALLVVVFGFFGDALKDLFLAISDTLNDATDTLNEQ